MLSVTIFVDYLVFRPSLTKKKIIQRKLHFQRQSKKLIGKKKDVEFVGGVTDKELFPKTSVKNYVTKILKSLFVVNFIVKLTENLELEDRKDEPGSWNKFFISAPWRSIL